MKRDYLIKLRGEVSQQIMADKLGISQTGLSLIESGDRTPSIKTMFRFETIYNKPMQELFPDIFLSQSITNRNNNESA